MEKDIAFKINIDVKDIERISPLSLAYLGDTVYESYIREYLLKKNVFTKINALHKSAIGYVSATSQARVIRILDKDLTEAERSVFKRGRNHKKTTGSKNASPIDYRYSTGFEALIGYLYLLGDKERLDYLVEKCINIIESE